jgi:hypothetical protein
MKPATPSGYRGKFKPIPTNVPGMEICQLMPAQAKIAAKFAILRGVYCVSAGISTARAPSRDSMRSRPVR